MLVSDSQNLTNQVKFPFLLSRNSLFLCAIVLVLLLLGRTCNYNLANIKTLMTLLILTCSGPLLPDVTSLKPHVKDSPGAASFQWHGRLDRQQHLPSGFPPILSFGSWTRHLWAAELLRPSWSAAAHTEAGHTQERPRASPCTLLSHGCSRASALANTAAGCLPQQLCHTQGGSSESIAEPSSKHTWMPRGAHQCVCILIRKKVRRHTGILVLINKFFSFWQRDHGLQRGIMSHPRDGTRSVLLSCFLLCLLWPRKGELSIISFKYDTGPRWSRAVISIVLTLR